MVELRPYQEEARQAIHAEWQVGHRKTLTVSATGTGKTIIFGSVAKDCVEEGQNVLILAHRGELLEQASDKLMKAFELPTVLEKAEYSSLGSDIPITVGSVQSLCQEKRLARFPEDYFQTIIVDEAHHALSSSYQKVLGHFDGAYVLGMTATPDRGDMRNLGEYFDSCAYEYTMSRAVREGNLCPVKAQMVPLELDISNVSVSNGDFSSGEIGNALEPYLDQIAHEMLRYCKDRKTVVFLPLVATSKKFCEILLSYGFEAA